MDLESIPPPLPPLDEEEVDSDSSDWSDSSASIEIPGPDLVINPPTTLNAQRTIRFRDYTNGLTYEETKTIGKNLRTDTTLNKLDLRGLEEIDRTVAYHLGRGLCTNTTLTVLLLTNCDLKQQSMSFLAQGLNFNNHLQVLDLKNNVDITPIAAENLFRALARGDGNLVKLNYSNNSLSELSGYKKALFFLSEMLSVTTSLTRLHLADTMMESLKPLSGGLKANTTLCSLNFNWSMFEDETNPTFWKEWLSLNGTLQTLILANSGIDEDLAVYIAAGLKVNIGLTHLNLSKNDLQEAGCRVIAEAVESNTTLRVLNLGWNQLDDSVGSDIADMIRNNTSLAVLYLCNNPLGEKALDLIADAMKKNKTIAKLELSGCEFGDNGWLKCMEMLLVNESLRQFHMWGAYTRTFTQLENGYLHQRYDHINLQSISPFITNCELLNKADKKEFLLAMFMSTHTRLGAHSCLGLLDSFLISNIWTCTMVLCKAWKYCPAYHYFLYRSILT